MLFWFGWNCPKHCWQVQIWILSQKPSVHSWPEAQVQWERFASAGARVIVRWKIDVEWGTKGQRGSRWSWTEEERERVIGQLEQLTEQQEVENSALSVLCPIMASMAEDLQAIVTLYKGQDTSGDFLIVATTAGNQAYRSSHQCSFINWDFINRTKTT